MAAAMGFASAAQSAADAGMAAVANNRSKAAARKAYARFRQARQTAYQDTMGDMRLAGLNPILAYSQGATGGSAIQQSRAPHSGNTVNAASAVSSAVQAKRVKNENALLVQQRQQVEAATDQADSVISLNEAAEDELRARKLLTQNNAQGQHIKNVKEGKYLPVHNLVGGMFDQFTPGRPRGKRAVKRIIEDRTSTDPKRRYRRQRGQR